MSTQRLKRRYGKRVRHEILTCTECGKECSGNAGLRNHKLKSKGHKAYLKDRSVTAISHELGGKTDVPTAHHLGRDDKQTNLAEAKPIVEVGRLRWKLSHIIKRGIPIDDIYNMVSQWYRKQGLIFDGFSDTTQFVIEDFPDGTKVYLKEVS